MNEVFDRRMLAHARAIADNNSPDPSTKVGCVLVHADHIVGAGFNAPPRRLRYDKSALLDRDWKLKHTVHAELAALLFYRGEHPVTMYTTHPPCLTCAMHILSGRVQNIVMECSQRNADYRERWAESWAPALRELASAGMPYRWVDL